VPVVLLDQEGGTYWDKALEFMREELVDKNYILPSDLRLMRQVRTPRDAGLEIARFYRNFHSSRWFNKTFVVRMNHPLNEGAMDTLHKEFADLCVSGGYEQVPYCPKTHNEPEFCNQFRLEFVFNDRDHGRLREMVDFINLPQNWKRND